MNVYCAHMNELIRQNTFDYSFQIYYKRHSTRIKSSYVGPPSFCLFVSEEFLYLSVLDPVKSIIHNPFEIGQDAPELHCMNICHSHS